MDSQNTADVDQYISPSELRTGLHVHIDLPWVDHPFSFSSFKIRSPEQIAVLRSLGLERIRYSPAKSDEAALPAANGNPPEPPHAAHPQPAPIPAQGRPDEPGVDVKRQRLERVASHRARIRACENELALAARSMRSITQDVFARPPHAYAEALALVNRVADSMLVEGDMSIHLMTDRLDGEEVYQHPLNVTLLSMMLAKELKLPSSAVRLLGLGALFHDIGKLDLPDRVVRKSEPLTRAEQAVLEQHCQGGVELSRKLNLPPEALIVIAQHHEHMDGSGYPKKLQGMQLALPSRIVGVANAYDNLCNPVNMKLAVTPHEALSAMYGKQRAHFDTAALNTFVRCMGVYPPGTLVGLSNDMVGMVVSVNSSRPLKPTVLVYEGGHSHGAPVIVDLEHEPDVAVAKTVRARQLAQEALNYLAPPRRMTYYFDAEPATESVNPTAAMS